MLDWSQDALAQASGLSLGTIYSLENGHKSLRSSMEVRKTLERKGFEFTGTNGLSRRLDEHASYCGPDAGDRFYEDVLATVKEKGGELSAITKTQEMLAGILGVTDYAKLDRMKRLSEATKVKCLVADPHNSSLAIPFFQIRVVAKQPLAPFSSFVYGNKTALIAKDGVDFLYFVMTSAGITQNSLNDFASYWRAAMPLTVPSEN